MNAANSSVISERYAHIGVVLYSSKMRMLFDFNKYYNSSQILQAIGNATYLKGGTRTGKALDFTRTELFEKSARKVIDSYHRYYVLLLGILASDFSDSIGLLLR